MGLLERELIGLEIHDSGTIRDGGLSETEAYWRWGKLIGERAK